MALTSLLSKLLDPFNYWSSTALSTPTINTTPTPTTSGSTAPVPNTGLLVDGSFESVKLSGTNANYSTVGGWKSSNNTNIEVWKSGFNGTSSTTGSNFIELDSDGTANNGIYQHVATEAGKLYTLEFDFAQRAGTSTETNAFQVFWNGSLVKTVLPGQTSWTKEALLVKGTGGNDKLEFREIASDKDTVGALLDNISLQAFNPSRGIGTNTDAINKIEITPEDRSFLFNVVNQPNQIRNESGFGNNLANPLWANADQPFVRLAPAQYGDTGSNPRGVVNGVQTLPNERTISNVISNQDENNDGIEEVQNNSFDANLFLMSFGQFFDHGLDFIKRGTERYSFTTETGSTISITRGEQVNVNGQINHINMTSPFVDQNQTYGSDDAVTYYLRKSIGMSPDGTGTVQGKSALLVSGPADSSGKETLPTYMDILLNNGVSKATIDAAISANNFSMLASDPDFVDFRNVKDPATGLPTGHALLLDINPNANPALANVPGVKFELKLLLDHYVGGDGRLNENIALTPIHTIWHREHDFQVDKLRDLNPTWSDEELFRAAKIIVEGEYQRVVFDEFADAMSGGIPGKGGHGFGGYDKNVNAGISEEFANAIYRVGHSMINETIPFTDASGKVVQMSLIDAFLNPRQLAGIGVDALIEGSTKVHHQRIDENLVNAVRNQLLGERLNDLGAINIARGRETGLPSLNEFRKYLYDKGLALGNQASDLGKTAKGDSSLRPYTGWADFAKNLRDPSLVEQFKKVYGYNDADVNKVDLWIGGLAEKPSAGQLGSTFGFIFREQLDRLQDGDRFYYKERLDDTQLLHDIESQSFADIIMRNSGLSYLHDDVFKVAKTLIMTATETNKTGTAAHEVLVGNKLVNNIDGGAGDDTIYAGLGNDVLRGGDGDDGLRGETGDDRVYGGNGNDRGLGGDGNDTIYGEAGDDALFGDNGNDTLHGQANDDELLGGAGLDSLYGGDGLDRLVGGLGNDTLWGESGDDELEGGVGDDKMYGGDGNDEFDGGAGNDYMDGGSNTKGAGAGDVLNYEDAGAGVTINLGTGKASGSATGNDTFTNMEGAVGSIHADTLIGDGKENVLDGNSGNDTLTGGNSNDVFVFERGSGLDRVTDLKSGDKLDLSDWGFGNISEVTARATQVGSATVIDLTSMVGSVTFDDKIALDNFQKSALNTGNVILVEQNVA